MKRCFINSSLDFDGEIKREEVEDHEGDWVKYEDAKVLEDLLNEWLNEWLKVTAVQIATPPFMGLMERTLEVLKK